MKINKYAFAFLIFAITAIHVLAQGDQFSYKRKVTETTKADWYGIVLPPDIFQHLNRSFSDIRLYTISTADTIEIPYLLKINEDQIKEEIIEIPVINKSKKDGVLYFSFEMKGHLVNYIDLQFKETNYNAFVKIEGGSNQQEWFELAAKQRILSIESGTVKYATTTVHFPPSNFKYLRISVQSDNVLNLTHASFRNQQIKQGVTSSHNATWKVKQDRKNKQTIIEVKLNNYVPVNAVAIDATNDVDYYRNFTVEYLSDSSKTPKGYTKFYNSLFNNYLTSVYPNSFTFDYQLVKELKITIYNNDNFPLSIKNIKVSGPQVELITKLKPGQTFMFYGNNNIQDPSYDLIHFSEKIPDSLSMISVEHEEALSKPVAVTSPFFKSQLWLWLIMGIVIAMLGFFTLRMMKNR